MDNPKINKIENDKLFDLFDPSDLQETFFNDYYIEGLPSYKKIPKESSSSNTKFIEEYFIQNYYPYKYRLNLKKYYEEKSFWGESQYEEII